MEKRRYEPAVFYLLVLVHLGMISFLAKAALAPSRVRIDLIIIAAMLITSVSSMMIRRLKASKELGIEYANIIGIVVVAMAALTIFYNK